MPSIQSLEIELLRMSKIDGKEELTKSMEQLIEYRASVGAGTDAAIKLSKVILFPVEFNSRDYHEIWESKKREMDSGSPDGPGSVSPETITHMVTFGLEAQFIKEARLLMLELGRVDIR